MDSKIAAWTEHVAEQQPGLLMWLVSGRMKSQTRISAIRTDGAVLCGRGPVHDGVQRAFGQMMKAEHFDVEGFRANFVANMTGYPELHKYDALFTGDELRCTFHALKSSATLQGVPLVALKDALDRVLLRIPERFNDIFHTGDLVGLIENIVTLIEKREQTCWIPFRGDLLR